MQDLEVLASLLLTEIVSEEDQDSEHFEGTPKRFVKMLLELTTPEKFEFTVFDSKHNEMIIESPIPFYSLCAHHVIPFFGNAHVAYVPDGKIAGLSKIARTVVNMAKGLYTQEDLTANISEHLEEHLNPLGVAVVLQAEHLCMSMRGARSPGTKTTTSIMTGVFIDPTKQARQEFLALIDGKM